MANKRTAEILDLSGGYTVILSQGSTEVARFNHLEKRSSAEFHGSRWVKQGRYIISVSRQFKPRKCADKKCNRPFAPKKRHGEYCSRRCGDRVRHERSYSKKVAKEVIA